MMENNDFDNLRKQCVTAEGFIGHIESFLGNLTKTVSDLSYDVTMKQQVYPELMNYNINIVLNDMRELNSRMIGARSGINLFKNDINFAEQAVEIREGQAQVLRQAKLKKEQVLRQAELREKQND